MIIGESYINLPESSQEKSVMQMIQEVCQNTDPKPVFCELPDDLKFKQTYSLGTQTYTYTSTLSNASGFGTFTTTTI